MVKRIEIIRHSLITSQITHLFMEFVRVFVQPCSDENKDLID